MTKITDASTTDFSIYIESEYGVLPYPLVGFAFGITGEGLAPNLTTVQSEELNPNPAIMDNLLSGVDVGGDVNFEVGAGNAMKTILKHALRSEWTFPTGSPPHTLKASNLHHSMSLLKTFNNEHRAFPFLYTGSRLNTLNFNITAEGGIITATTNFMCKNEGLLPDLGVYQSPDTDNLEKSWVSPYAVFLDTVDPMNNHIMYLDPDSNTWMHTYGDAGCLLHADDKIVVDHGDPIGIPASATVYFDLDTGCFWRSDGAVNYARYQTYGTNGANGDGLSILSSSDKNMFSGITVPDDSIGATDDTYIITGDTAVDPDAGRIYQKLDTSWVNIGFFKADSGFNPTLFYNGAAVFPKDVQTKMHIPQFKNILVTDVGEPICFTDLGFTIDNKCENVKGLCTDNQDYPHLSAVATKYGGREITGNATILFNSVELYENYFKQGKELGISFSMENGQGYGWKFVFPRIKFSEGSVNASGKGENVEIPFKWVALYDHTEGCDAYVEVIEPCIPYPTAE